MPIDSAQVENTLLLQIENPILLEIDSSLLLAKVVNSLNGTSTHFYQEISDVG
jgi:uncharacterized membrane-anchored protein